MTPLGEFKNRTEDYAAPRGVSESNRMSNWPGVGRDVAGVAGLPRIPALALPCAGCAARTSPDVSRPRAVDLLLGVYMATCIRIPGWGKMKSETGQGVSWWP
jgi:hypothetical protein